MRPLGTSNVLYLDPTIIRLYLYPRAIFVGKVVKLFEHSGSWIQFLNLRSNPGFDFKCARISNVGDVVHDELVALL